MWSLQEIENDLTAAIKAKNQLAADTLRGLKARIQNEKISKLSRGTGSSSGGNDLSEADLVALVRSEIKRRREAVLSYRSGGRPELADKEAKEAAILETYLPKQLSESEISEYLENFLAQNQFTAKDFGAAMGQLKAKLGQSVDGAMLAKLLKEKLK